MDECSTNLSHTNGNAGQLDNKGGAHNKDGRIKPRFNWKEWSWRRRVRKNSELNSQGLTPNSVTIAVTEKLDTLKLAGGGPDYPGLMKGEPLNTRKCLVLIGFLVFFYNMSRQAHAKMKLICLTAMSTSTFIYSLIAH